MNFDFKKILPHLIAIVIFAVLVFAYFMPLFQGKSLAQHDIAQWQGMSKSIADFRTKTGQEPLWTNSMFSGMPAYQISVLYPANLMSYVNSIISLGLTAPASFIFMAMLCFYILMITLKIDYRLAIGGAIAYAFVSYNLVALHAGHNSKVHAISLFPLVIAGVLMVFNKKYLLGAALTALALSLEIYANHLQITYYLTITILCLVIAKSISIILEKDFAHLFKTAALLGVAVALAILPNITNLLATEEYGKASTRGPSELSSKKASTGLDEDYALSYSNGKTDAFSLLVPNITGGASQTPLDEKSALYKALESNGVLSQAQSLLDGAPTYWGGLYSTAGPVYVGAIIIFLFILGLILVKGPDKWWLLIATLLSITLSFGKYFMPLTDFFFHYFPAYNKFRAVSMTLVIASFTIPLLAFMGLQKLFDDKIPIAERTKALLYSFYAVAGLCVLILVSSLFFKYNAESDNQLAKYPYIVNALKEDRASMLRMDTLRSLVFIALAFGLLWFTLKGKIKSNVAYICLAFLFLVDAWPVAKRYLNSNDFTDKQSVEVPFQPTNADLQIDQDKSLGFRVMNTSVSTFNDASTSYFHNSIGGYHGAKLKRYQELIENQISNGNQSVLDMLNTKYFIMQNRQTGQPEAQMNPGACGSAWFVPEIKYVANADSEIKALDKFNPKEIVFIDERFKKDVGDFKPAFDSTASITLTVYDPNHVAYKSNATSEQFAVLSEIYYDKGWNAYIDDKPTTYVRCNYVLRGMKVPAGNHKIDFRFEPAVYITGERIAFAGSILLIAGFLIIVFLELRKLPPPAPPAPKPVVEKVVSKKK
ncbi:MAG: YfhO family protein [Bacteroidia bacterium]